MKTLIVFKQNGKTKLKMLPIFITLILYTSIVKSDNDTKYLDLLPEKEKAEFLEKIARRILKEVETTSGKYEKSIEVPDSQLDKQNDFVHKILQEENEKLKLQTSNPIDSNLLNTNYSPPALREEENKLLQYVDLTLRSDIDKNRTKRDSKRRVFTGFASEEKSDEDAKDVKGPESELDVQVRNFKQKTPDKNVTNKLNDKSLSKNAEKRTQEKYNATLEHDSDENNITQILRRMYEENEQTDITTEKMRDNKSVSTIAFSSNDVNQTTVSNDERSEIETSTIDSTDNYFATEATASEPIPYEVIQRTFYPLANSSFDDSLVDTENRIENGNLRAYSLVDVEETVVLRNSNVTESINFTETTQYSKVNSTQSLMTTPEPNEHTNDSKVINIDVITVSPVETSIHYSNENTRKDFVKHTTSKIQVLTTTPGNVNSKPETSLDSMAISRDDITKSENKTTKGVREKSKAKKAFKNKIRNATKLLLNGVMKSLRENLLVPDNKKEKTSAKPIQIYNVYEIAPEAQPFVKIGVIKKPALHKKTLPKTSKLQSQKIKKPVNEPDVTIIQEEPHYVPVYNYQPKNAFYNPHEALELNSNKDGDNDSQEKRQYGESLSSLKSIDHYDNEERSANTNSNNQPLPVPIYVYAPQNAFFDHYNNLGPNANDEAIKEENDVDNDLEYTEEYNDEPERSNTELQYQYYVDPNKHKLSNIKVSNIKKNLDNKKFTLNNLKKILIDLVLNSKIKNTPNVTAEDILSKDLDWDSKKQKALLRCLYKKKCGKGKDSDEKDNSKEDGEVVDPDAGFDSTFSKARHLMLVSGHYALDNQKANLSKKDEFFESAERIVSKEKGEDKEPGDNSRYKRAREMLRALLEKNELLSRKPLENQNLDIAMDYYFEKPKRTRERKQKDIDTPKIAIILDKSNKETKERQIKNKIALLLDKGKKEKRIDEALRDTPKPQRKPDKYFEYMLIKDLSDKLPGNNLEKLYWQLEFLDKLNYLRLNSDKNVSKELDVYVEVLSDMVKENHKGLVHYDWLGTAVDLQTAIRKMALMAEQVLNDETIHPSDLELIKYLVWLHTFAKEELNQFSIPKELRGMKIPLSKKHRGKIIKESGLLYREWLNRIRPKPIPDEEVQQFQEFVERLQNCLHDLHTALKYIAMVTKYKRQNWFENLKQIHLDDSRKRIIELLIHLSSTRLIGMIEVTSKKGLEDNFKKYIKTHEKEVEDTKEEFVFVMSLIKEFEKLNK